MGDVRKKNGLYKSRRADGDSEAVGDLLGILTQLKVWVQ